MKFVKGFKRWLVSLNELDALLSKGGIASLNNSEQIKSKQKQRPSKKRTSGRIDIRQGQFEDENK